MTEPTPVTPLEYSDRSHEPWLPMIRFMAIAASFYAAIPILSYLLRVVWILGQQFAAMPMVSLPVSKWIPQLLVELPSEIAATIILVGGLMAVQRSPGSRKTLLVGIVAYVICNGLYNALLAVSGLNNRLPGHRMEILLFWGSPNFFSLAERYFVPALLWLFFRKAAIREAMDVVV